MNEDQFIEKILNSTNGIQQVTPRDAIFSKIKNRIQAEKPVDNYIALMVAASIVLLISLNVGILSTSNTESSTVEGSSLVSTANNQLY